MSKRDWDDEWDEACSTIKLKDRIEDKLDILFEMLKEVVQ